MNKNGETAPFGLGPKGSSCPLRSADDRLRLFGVAAAIVAVFAYSLSFGFLEWDDPVYLTRNPLVQSLSLENISAIFTTFLSGNYHPLPLLTYMAEHALFGLNPLVYKLDNLLLHILNAALLYALLRKLGFGPRAVFLATLFFAVHPLKAEPVAWVTGRKDLLSAFFSLCSLNAHAAWVERGEKRFFALAFFLFVAAILSKGTAMALPLLYFAVDLAMKRKMSRGTIAEKLPHLAVAILLGVIALYARQSYQGTLVEEGFGAAFMAFSAIHRLFSYYFLRSFIPLPHIFSPYLASPGLTSPLVIFSVAGVAFTAATLFALRKKIPREVWIGLLFFATAIAPSLPLPVVGYTADRFAYLPSVGLSLALCPLLSLNGRQKTMAAVMAALLVFIAGAALLRTRVWRDDVTIATDALASFEGKSGLEFNLAFGHANRAAAYLRMGEPLRALEDLKRSETILPKADLPFVETGEALLQIGEHEKALESFGHRTAGFPYDPTGNVGKAKALIELKRYGEAAQSLAEAQAIAPGYEEIYRVWEKGAQLAPDIFR